MEQTETATAALVSIFFEDEVDSGEDLQMRSVYDDFFWSTVMLTEDEIAKLANENRITISPNQEVSIY